MCLSCFFWGGGCFSLQSSCMSVLWWQQYVLCSGVASPDCKTFSKKVMAISDLHVNLLPYSQRWSPISKSCKTDWSLSRGCVEVKAGKRADWKDLLLFGKACWSKPKTMLWCVNQTPCGERPVTDEKETDRCVLIGGTYRKSTGIKVALIWQCLHQALWSKISIITATSVALVNGRFKEWYFSMKCKFNPIRLHITNKPCPINQPSINSLCYFQNNIIATIYTAQPILQK